VVNMPAITRGGVHTPTSMFQPASSAAEGVPAAWAPAPQLNGESQSAGAHLEIFSFGLVP
jgi:hypothetical protein